MAIPQILRSCALLLLALLLVACAADDPAGDDAADDGADADDPADPDDPGDDGDPAATDDAPSANLTGCVDEPADGVDYFPERVAFSHAETVSASYHDTYKVLDIALPFDDGTARFVLVQCGLDAPALDGDLEGAAVIEVPIASAVTMTTTNIPHFDALGALDRLVGVGNTAFVSTESVRDAIAAGDVEGFAEADGSPDLERVIAAQPDVLWLDAFGDAVLDTAARLADAGVPVLLGADFEETTLLGRAEWVKVTAMLLNAEAAATDLFDDIEAAYTEVAEQVADVDERPRVLNGMPFEGTWFAPGGRSVTATAIAEAGGEYVFADDESTDSVAFDLETVLDRGSDADVWIAAGSVHGTLDDVLAADSRFGEITAFQQGQVWAGDAATTPEGGNDRFESAYLRADLFLADLAAMFHPDLVDHDPVYYGRVPEG